MSSKAEKHRWHLSFAVRLGLWHMLLTGAAAVFVLTAVYLLVARALDAREREALELRSEQLALAFVRGGVRAMRATLEQSDESPHVRSLFVRIVGRDGSVTFAKAPPEWSTNEETSVLVPDGWGFWRPERIQTVRVPRDEQRDFAIVSRTLPGGILLQVARSTDNQAVLLSPLRRTMFIAGPAGVLFAALVGAGISWRATRPVRQVASTAKRIIATGDMSSRVPATGREDEIGELVVQFNTLLERNGSLLRAMREALDNVAHDVRTPLTRLRAGAEAALAQESDSKTSREALADCIEETDRIRRLLDTLLDISAAEAGVLALEREPVDVPAMLDEVVELYSIVAEEKNVALEMERVERMTTWADPTRLRQVVANLVDNAVKYTPAGGRVTVSAARRGDRVLILIRDTGPGVPSAEQDKIWRRLYRADRSRSQRGLGLGLSTVKAIVEAHGGRATVMNHAEGGAVFGIELPAQAPVAVAKPTPAIALHS